MVIDPFTYHRAREDPVGPRCGGMCAQGDTDHTVHPLKFTQDKDRAAGAAAEGCTVLGQGPGLHLAQQVPGCHCSRQRRILCEHPAPPLIQSTLITTSELHQTLHLDISVHGAI